MSDLAALHNNPTPCPHQPPHDGQEGAFLACLKMKLDEIREDIKSKETT